MPISARGPDEPVPVAGIVPTRVPRTVAVGLTPLVACTLAAGEVSGWLTAEDGAVVVVGAPAVEVGD
jgi:hypothetical protein